MDYDKEDILTRLRSYCAYQERCRQEVKDKMYKLGVPELDKEEFMEQLEKESFLDEARFATTYASGKFRMKGWGPRRIRHELKARGLSDENVNLALQEIDEEEALEELRKWIEKKGQPTNQKEKAKLIRFLVGKGFDQGMILGVLEEK